MGGDVFQNSANAMSGGMGATADAMGPAMVQQTMNQYLNPYQGQVIDDTMGRMQDMQANDLNMVRGQAAGASAFGGARHGLVESELMNNYNRNAYETVGSMNKSGFDTAAQFGQNRIGQIMGGAGQLMNAAPTALQMGQSVMGQQQQAGAQQQALMQSLLGMAGQQYDTLANYPQQALSTAMAGVQGNPLSGNMSSSGSQGYNPGLFDYASMGAGIMGGGK